MDAVGAAVVKKVHTKADPGVWVEKTAKNGRKYYVNKKTRQSTWVKPEELGTVRAAKSRGCELVRMRCLLA